MVGALVLTSAPCSATAEEKITLGCGRLLNNDAVRDGRDRWHTRSYTISAVPGAEWNDVLPDQFGQIVEWRFRADMIAPSALANPDPSDRHYAGSLSLGVHSQANWHRAAVKRGADLTAIGLQTGISGFQARVHHIVTIQKPNTANQIGTTYRPSRSGKVGRTICRSPSLSFHPFLAAEAGVKTLVRVGRVLVIGHFGEQSVMLRDDVTGQRYRAAVGTLIPGLSF